MIGSSLLYGIALPFLLSGVCLGVGWRLWSRKADPVAGGKWSGSPAMAFACVAGSFVLWGWPGFPPKVAEGWLPFLAACGIAAGMWINRARRWKVAAWMLLSVVAVVSALGPRRATLSMAESLVWHVGLTAAATALHASTDVLLERRKGVFMPLSIMLWCGGLGLALAMTGSLKYGQMAGLMMAALGAAVMGAWLKPILSLAHGATSVIVPWNTVLLICGHFYSDLTAIGAFILACAPASLWIAETGPIVRCPAWVGSLTRAMSMVITITLALLLT